jgi:hypothetical protein
VTVCVSEDCVEEARRSEEEPRDLLLIHRQGPSLIDAPYQS